ncbi:MAG TPA: multiheme c-type cytochrome [Mucilaginibacter sp.]|jgi:nitrate/TMAO reductase-like tetraheme cytochrome c subunit
MKKIIVISTILLTIIIIFYFKSKGDKSVDPRGDLYVGSVTCIKCHSELYKSYLHTAHYIASVPACVNTIHGSFIKNFNEFDISPSQKIVMEKRHNGMFQTYYLNGKMIESHRFDIVLGGIKGESYLYWKDNGLYQLPISYYSKKNQWLISPGYAPGQVDFNRIIKMRCLECHASNINDAPGETEALNGPEQFDKSSLVYGIDCERCHGPAAQHVDFQTKNPQEKTAHFIKTYASLPRERKLDMCAVCHSGNKSEMIRSTFYFVPGDTLAKFKIADFYRPISDSSHLDVHGNQLQLLQSSKCFIKSKMDCTTCHDTHQNQRGNTALFTQKCLTCHSTVNHNYCKMANTSNATLIKANCIQCHMPALTTMAIISPNMNKTFSADIAVHTHHIAIYPQEAKKILGMVAK